MNFNFKNLSENIKRIRIIPKNDTELVANVGVDNPTAMIDEDGVFSVCLSPTINGEIPHNEIHFTTIAGSVDYIGTQGDQILLSDGTIVDVTSTEETFPVVVPVGKHIVKLVDSIDRSRYVSIGGEALVELHNFPTLSSIDTFNTYLCTNLVKVPTVLPSNLTNLGLMFNGATSFNQDISMWDTSNVTEMFAMFHEASTFNQPLNSWDVSNVTDMFSMFYNANSFNQDLSSWCVSNITSLPNEFDTGANNWILPRPVWRTCPT